MKLVFFSSILHLQTKANEVFKLLLFLTAFLTGTQDLDFHKAKENTKPNTDKEIKNAETTALLTCSITSMEILGKSGCRDNFTEPDWTDDYYEVNLKIIHPGASAGNIIEVDNSHLMEQPQNAVISSSEAANGYSILYSCKMQTDIDQTDAVPGWVPMGQFTINIKDGPMTLCTNQFTFNNANNPDECHERPCSVCLADQGAWNTTAPACWPDETPSEACEDVLNHAPDPNYLEHTPLKYVKVMLHIFQVADPNSPNEPHPVNGPQHFSSQHIDVIKSWIDGPQGVNQGILANLCASEPSTSSPHIPDSRIRFLLEHGEEGKDIFFHPNTAHWAISLAGCGTNNSSNALSLKGYYVTNPNASLPPDYINWISLPENRDALHIFISRGRWIDMDNDGPDPNLGLPTFNGPDCFNDFPGGFTWPNEAGCTDNPAQYLYGGYDRYLGMFDQNGELKPGEDPSSLGKGLVGEFFHVMSLDHISPFQIHHEHEVGIDGCDDSNSSQESNNMLGCNYEERCHLSECQLGRMHRFFESQQPGFERFFVGNNANGQPIYSMESNCKIVDTDIVINSGETVDWNGPKNLRCNVLVKSGGKLYIRCRVGMPEGAKITVETNGRLFLYGEVYNNCSGKRWQGIVVNGNSGLPQAFPPTNQGYFVAFDGSIIEGANTSIRVESGGMSLAFGCDIRNSGGALFEPYSYPNTSRFVNCDFTCNGNVFAFADPYFHAKLHGVRGVRFTNCDLSVENVPQALAEFVNGVNGDGSNFTVTGSTFTGFDTGIHASGFFSPFKTITVNNCTFTDNKTGIFTLGMQNCAITQNTFYVRGASSIFDNPCGLMMDNSTGYVVEKNHFYKASNSSLGRYGTMTEESGPDANFIKGNFFKDLEDGNFAQGNNRGFKAGLQYWCNTDEGNVPTDFYVEGVGLGIHTNQGNGKATMNTFSHTGNDFENNVGSILYYFKQNDAAHQPSNLSIGINKIPVQPLNTCPGGGGNSPGLVKLTSTEWTEIENGYNAAKAEWDTQKAAILALMDGGNTASLLAQINGATSQNAGQVTQQLLNLSPYLSNQALSAAIAKKQVLTENAVVQVLNANPDELREAEIRDLVNASFSSTVANGILANAANTSARTALDNEAGEYRATMQEKADLLLIDIANDSLQTDLTLFRTWLEKKESLEASYAIVGTYLSVGDFTTALQKLAEIPTNFPQDAQGTVEHGYFEDLVDIWQGIYTSGTPIHALDSATIDDLKYIADNSKRRAGAMAQGVLNTWYGHHYRVVPQSGGSLPIVAPPLGTNVNTITNYVTAFPNPAKEKVVIEWTLPNGVEYATIALSDMQGRVIEVLKIAGKRGKKEWSTTGLNGGIYLYQLKLPDGVAVTEKLVIIK